MYVCVYVCMYVCMFVCLCVYLCTYLLMHFVILYSWCVCVRVQEVSSHIEKLNPDNLRSPQVYQWKNKRVAPSKHDQRETSSALFSGQTALTNPEPKHETGSVLSGGSKICLAYSRSRRISLEKHVRFLLELPSSTSHISITWACWVSRLCVRFIVAALHTPSRIALNHEWAPMPRYRS